MRTSDRRSAILHELFLAGYVGAKELSERLNVDASTIRRDLDVLAREGRLQRTHGGARPVAGAYDVPYAIKEHERLPAKNAVAAAAAALVSDGQSVLLDSGSTTHQVALALATHKDLTIVTNDLLIARDVTDFPGVRLLVTGGELLGSTYTLFGDHTSAYLASLRVDWVFLGADAIDLPVGITNTNTLEVPVKRAMIAAGRTCVVVTDSTKFGHQALVRVADLTEVDQIITDDELCDEAAAAYGPQVRRVPVGKPAGAASAMPAEVP